MADVQITRDAEQGGWRLVAEQHLSRPIEEVFGFFANAGNLQRITPPWIRFCAVTPAHVTIEQNTQIDYNLRIRGLPMRWRSLISQWDPPHRFVDEQLRGPYRRWHHEHTFESTDDGTLIRDVVHYDLPLRWLIGWLVHPVFVRRDLQKIFSYRQKVLADIFS